MNAKYFILITNQRNGHDSMTEGGWFELDATNGFIQNSEHLVVVYTKTQQCHLIGKLLLKFMP